MNSASRSRRNRVTIILALAAFALTPALSACNSRPTIQGWSCTGYRLVTARPGDTFSAMVVRSTKYPHTAANTKDIQDKVTSKYGLYAQAGKKYSIATECHR